MNASRAPAPLTRRGWSLVVLALVALLPGCGGSGSGHGGSAFVFLSVDLFSTSGGTPVAVVNSFLTDDGVSTQVCVTLRNNLKNPTVTTPTSLDNVLIQSYTVTFTRQDGGPPPGPFTFNTTVLVPAGTPPSTANPTVTGNTARFPIVLVPAPAKREDPLRPFPRLPLAATAEVLFRGRDGRGQRVETQGALTVVFGAEGSDTAPTCG